MIVTLKLSRPLRDEDAPDKDVCYFLEDFVLNAEIVSEDDSGTTFVMSDEGSGKDSINQQRTEEVDTDLDLSSNESEFGIQDFINNMEYTLSGYLLRIIENEEVTPAELKLAAKHFLDSQGLLAANIEKLGPIAEEAVINHFKKVLEKR